MPKHRNDTTRNADTLEQQLTQARALLRHLGYEYQPHGTYAKTATKPGKPTKFELIKGGKLEPVQDLVGFRAAGGPPEPKKSDPEKENNPKGEA